jgi:uncharacterized protein YcbX
MLVGKVAWLRRYPVKSLRGELVNEVQVAADGIVGDRTRRLVVRSGHERVGLAYRGKENDRLHLADRPEEAVGIASGSGVDVLVESGDHFFDDAAISLLFDRWLEPVGAHVGYPVEPERFRPNFFVRSEPSMKFDELALVGRELEIGDVLLRVTMPNERCVAINYHPKGEASDARILRYLAQEQNGILGVYCEVLRAGIARTGDSVRLADR